MAGTKDDFGLIGAVIFSGIIISVSILFVGMKIDGGGADDKVSDKKEVVQESGGGEPVKAEAEKVNVKKVDADYDHVRGDKDAAISIVEYSDFECPFCHRVHPTLKQIVDDNDGKVNWVYRHFPLGSHEPEASDKAEAAECVAELKGNDAFWAYADILYGGEVSGEEEELTALAVKQGVNKADFKKCLDSDKHLERIKTDMLEGIQAGVNGTPGNIVLNNKTGEAIPVMGAQPIENFMQAIKSLE